MPQLTGSGSSRVCRSSSLLTELRILSAILHAPLARNTSICSRLAGGNQLRYFELGGSRKTFDWQSHDNRPCPVSSKSRNFHTSPCRQAAQPARRIHFWQSLDDFGPKHQDGEDQFVPRKTLVQTDEKSQQEAEPGPRSKSLKCALCQAELSSEDALDEHLISCWSNHEEKFGGAEAPGASRAAKDWSLEEEKAKLDHVRRLEDELRKARHELQTLSRRRQSSLDGSGILEVYSEARPISNLSISKQDYLNLVDIYFHATQTESASSPDASPNPIFLEDQPYEYDLAGPEEPVIDQDLSLSMLAHVDERLRNDKLAEIKITESFINLLLDEKSPYEYIFQAYQRFPSPGIKYIPSATIRTFLHRMSLPPRKTPTNMLRYLSIIDEMQEAKMPISRAEWNAAIHLAGKSFNNIKDTELRRSVEYWRKMEQEAGIRASSSTFNIMFDVAVKAGQLLFAKELLREMTRRGTRLNRIGRVSHIWYCGKLGDADAVRQAYRDFVEAGEIVDTLVLNTVMVSLCNAGEGEAAEQIYERMKDMQLRRETSETSKDDSAEVKAIFTRYPPPGSQNLGSQMASHHLRRLLIHAPKLRYQARDSYLAHHSRAYLRPDAVTYRTFLAYHAEKTGNLDRLTVLLDDMTRVFGIRMTSMTFLLLFKGFAMNGNTRHSIWSPSRLNTVWEAFSSAMKASAQPNVLKAFRPIDPEPSDILNLKQGPNRVLSPDSFFNSFDNDDTDEPTSPTTNRSDIDEIRSRVFDQSPWGRFLRDFAATPEQKEEADLDLDPGGADEPPAYPLPSPSSGLTSSSSPSSTEDYFVTRPSKWLIIWCLRAFATCTQSRRKVEEVYFELMEHWVMPTEGQRETVDMVVRSCLRDVDSGVRDRQWWRRRQAHGEGGKGGEPIRMQW